MTAVPDRPGQGASSPDTEGNGARRRQIAVVAVHGVADQQPHESARQIADLLLRSRYGREGATEPQTGSSPHVAAKYTSFREFPLRIPVDPALPKPVTPNESPDVAFTRGLLQEYVAERDAYETVRLEGQRLTPPGPAGGQDDQADVHVYEMYWADLSRLGTGVVGVAGAAFQLMSSLAALGLSTIEGTLPAPHTGAVRGYHRAHRVSVWSLTVLIPWLNLALMSVALSAPVSAAPSRVQAVAFATLVVIVLAWVTGSLWLKAGTKFPTGVQVAVALVFVWVAGGVVLTLCLWNVEPLWNRRLALGMWGALSVLAIVSLGKTYQRRHNGVLPVARTVAAVVGLGFVFVLVGPKDEVLVAERIVRLFEWLFLPMAVAWIVVIASAGVSGLLAWRLCVRRPVVRRASWTAATTLALTVSSVSVVAVVLWSALQAITTRALPTWELPRDSTGKLKVDSLPDSTRLSDGTFAVPTRDGSYAYRSSIPLVVLARDDSNTAPKSTSPSDTSNTRAHPASNQICFARDVVSGSDASHGRCERFSQRSMPRYMMSVSAASGLVVALVALVLVLVCGLVLAGPSVLREITPTFRKLSAREASASLGLWLTIGFKYFRIATIIAYVLVVALTLAVAVIGLWLLIVPERALWAAEIFSVLRSVSDSMTVGIGSLVAASTVTVVVLLSRFQNFARVVRPVLDVMLDVDNYLRAKPTERPPRARMFARLVSLLRYLALWRRNDRGYDAVVLVTHSQGTVMVAEALRFHKQVGFVELPTFGSRDNATTPAVFLMTMGSPLRQLYERSFPHLFEWAGPAETPKGGPRCDAVGVRQWMNVYRSGDYVGRSLWRSEHEASTFDATSSWCAVPHETCDGDASCRERCLGAGAHTHYWDSTADDVAECLDELIGRLAPQPNGAPHLR